MIAPSSAPIKATLAQINRGRGYQNLRYLLLKAQRLAAGNSEFTTLTTRLKNVA
jgi:hypothetical protein